MARVFVDDSGNSNEEPVMYVAGWVGQVPAWEAFTDDWDATLKASNPKPIRYFKHSEAVGLFKCFDGFTDAEARSKMLALAEVIARHEVYGVAYAVGRQFYQRMIGKYAVTLRGRAHKMLEDPFYICMNSLIGYVVGSESVGHPDDKIDFIFDGKPGSGQAKRLIAMFETSRDFSPEPDIRRLLGSAIPMNDMDVLPLQAADLLAGQMRVVVRNQSEDPEPLGLIRRRRFVYAGVVSEEAIRLTINYHNAAISTRRLSTIKREREREKK
ncbi:MAG: hypothetical protein WCD76_09815 [Pyrinomonadaceae bacterium]